MRSALLAFLALSLCGCGSIVFKLPTRQGNVIEQKQLDQLKVGMTREQVKFLLGTPIAANPFRDDRWDYVGYYKTPRGEVSSRTVTLYFQGDALTRMEGLQTANAAPALETPDVNRILKEEKKDKLDSERAKTGGSTDRAPLPPTVPLPDPAKP